MTIERSIPDLASTGFVGRRLWVVRSAPQHGRAWSPLLREGTGPLFLAGDLLACAAGGLLAGPANLVATITFTAVLVLAYGQLGLYRSRLALSVLVDLPRLAVGWALATALGLLAAEFELGHPTLRAAVLVLVAVVIIRVISSGAVRFMRSSGRIVHDTVILGAGRTGTEVAERIIEQPDSGLRVAGFVDRSGRRVADLPAPLLGAPSDLVTVMERYHPRALVVAYGSVRENELVDTVRAAHRHRCEVFVVPRLYEIQHVATDMDFVGDVPLVRLRRAAYRSWAWRIKRLGDVVLAGLALLLLSPLLLACAIAVRLEGGPGVIFRQERVGCDGRRFQLMKFRSLRPVDDTESATHWNISHDDRLGPVGRFLRKSSIDELPQLINILRGDMSFVGPRPERPHFVAEFGLLYRGYDARHRVPSGLTGWAQIHGLRGDTSIAQRARFDNFYIENWSIWMDVTIILRTVVSVVRSPGS